MKFIYAATYLTAAFLGYVVGRGSHMIGGSLASPHHWIYALVLVIVGIFFERKKWGVPMIMFGIGLFVSDANDFMHLRFYGVDVVKEYKFWNIN